MEKIYNKLVRDNIPNIIEKNREIPVIRFLDDEQYVYELNKKLKEEVAEVLKSRTNKEVMEELADVLEVLETIAKLHGGTLEEIEKISKEKREKRGGFEKKIFLEKVVSKKNEECLLNLDYNKKNLILDFGNVLAKPSGINWFITPKFMQVIDMSLIDLDKINEAFNKYNYIIERKMNYLEEEYDNFTEFYDRVLKEINYPKYKKNLPVMLGIDFTYSDSKYTFFDNIAEELEVLSSKYNLFLLTDNWPSIIRILKDRDLDKYFIDIYVSSNYGYRKRDGIFFDYLLYDYDLDSKNTLFIDDEIVNLEVASSKGLNVLLMDRENKNDDDIKYKKIRTLKQRG